MLFRFLLAQLHLRSLTGKRSPKAMKTALRELPAGSEVYDHAYKEAMERIEGQNADSERLAKDVLSWITCAKNPFTTLELRHALAVEISASELDENNLPEIEDMVSVCAGLVTVDKESDIIRLIHYTTQEYFQRTWTSWFPNAERDIGMTCVTYLSFNSFKTGYCPKDKFQERLRENALYGYAARNWAYHARASLLESEQLILNFLESEPKVSSSFQAVVPLAGPYHYNSGLEKRSGVIRGVHLAAYFGLTETIRILLKNGHDKDSRDNYYGQTPLSWAASEGHEGVVKLLLEEEVDADSKDDDGQTPLLLAAGNGQEAVVKQLLTVDGVDVNSKDNNSQTAMLLAAEKGHEVVVKQLLAVDGVDVNSKDDNGRTALLWAAGNGHKVVVKQLLAVDGVDINSKDNEYSQTALSWAARDGNEAVVKQLLAVDGVDVNSKDDNGRTALLWAGGNGHKAVVKQLLAVDGVDVNSKDNVFGRTVLSWEARNGNEAEVKQLLAVDGVDVNSKDNNSQTAISLAAENGHEVVVKHLLAIDGVDVNSKDNSDRTALSWAAWNGHKVVVKQLLAVDGVDVNSKDRGQMALSRAA